MQRKVYVPGTAALLAALLAGCTGGSGAEGGEDGKSGDAGGSTQAAEPGKYRTLPEPCGTVDRSTLDSMLPGLEDIEDAQQREKAYAGSATVTYDTDRRVGCRWKVESTDATHRLRIDFERVVSYDGAVSDDTRAQEVYRKKLREADIPEPEETEEPEESEETEETGEPEEPAESGSPKAGDKDDKGRDGKGKGGSSSPSASRPGAPEPHGGPSAHAKGAKGAKAGDGAAADAEPDPKESGDPDEGTPDGDDTTGDDTTGSEATGAAETPDGYEPRTLDDLGDEAFLDDLLAPAASAARQRTVTVVFRTSNVIVTVEYDEQPGRRTEVPDAKEMQDNARELAEKLGDRFDG
ncbi:DUF3558 domain-containing protein [Streptomyces sp. G45]|uniref:DUF3558 domain-containing protein n=1 Tax=Streptomyces sp. G45 TaxID=3406627 RepID=UPI003C28ACE8